MPSYVLTTIQLILFTSQRILAHATHFEENLKKISATEQCARLIGAEFHSRHFCSNPATRTAVSEPSKWAPWTHPPYCVDRNYCVFTNSQFRGNRGISVITTPESIANSTNLLDILFIDPPEREPSPANYKMEDIPGKGVGVVATRPIKKHDVIMVDPAAILADVDLPGKLKHEDGIRLFDRAMDQLPDPMECRTLARSSIDHRAPLSEDVMRTNSFGLPLNDLERMALFPKVARINHACDPNSAIRWTAKTLEIAVVALRYIKAGEEITISYSNFGMTYNERQKMLKSRWGFKCTCSLCSAKPSKIRLSDLRRERIRELTNEILALVNKKKINKAIDLHKELLKLTMKEGLTSQLGEHYWVRARLHSAVADKHNTIKFAKLAREELKSYARGGSEMDDTLADLEQFLGTPKK